MFRIAALLCLVIFIATPAIVIAQTPKPNSQLAPEQYDPETDPDIDMFMGSWKDSMPRNIHGSLVVRDILTSCDGDPLRPARKGACLTELKSVSFATLEPGASTAPVKLAGEQEIYYIKSGTGVITSQGKTAELREGVGIVMAPGIEFFMKNTGDEALTMYRIVEPIPEGFTANTEMVVRNEYDNPQQISIHWANIDRSVLGANPGTAVVSGLTSVKIDPMTMAQPHSHGTGVEEVWIAIKGDIKVLFGKQLRNLPVGSAYKIPPDGRTAHANINLTDTQVKLIHMMKNLKTEYYPYGQLNPEQFNPETDPDIDMFMGNWKQSMPRNIHGSLVVRDMLTSCQGDAMHPKRRGACLTYLKSVSFATLEPGASTTPVALDGEQELYYIQSGTGIITSRGKTAELYEGVGIVIAPGIEYSMTNNGSEHLTMYRIVEPIPTGFKTNTEMVVTHENKRPAHMSVHWANIDRGIITRQNGTAVVNGLTAVKLDPMTMAQPHSHGEGVEEVWIALKGDIKLLLGKQLRNLPVGSAYKIPSDGITAHANFNVSGDQVKLIHMMRVPPK